MVGHMVLKPTLPIFWHGRFDAFDGSREGDPVMPCGEVQATQAHGIHKT